MQLFDIRTDLKGSLQQTKPASQRFKAAASSGELSRSNRAVVASDFHLIFLWGFGLFKKNIFDMQLHIMDAVTTHLINYIIFFRWSNGKKRHTHHCKMCLKSILESIKWYHLTSGCGQILYTTYLTMCFTQTWYFIQLNFKHTNCV